MKALFAFTVGPVKALIENSRKMNDLYGGSILLSQLTKDAICYIQKKDFDVIFPVIDEQEGDSNIPNRFIAQINDYDEQALNDYQQIAEKLADTVRANFKVIGKETFIAMGIKDKKQLNLAINQLADFLEIHWLYHPYKADTDYQEAYQSVFKKLQAVKNIRLFDQNQEFWGRKCTLFPEYNAIFIKNSSKKPDTLEYPRHINLAELERGYIDVTHNKTLQYLIKPKEALSAIGLMKRFYGNERKVNSLRNMLLEVYYKEIKACEEYQDLSKKTAIANIIYDLLHDNKPTAEQYCPDLIEIAQTLYKNNIAGKVHLSSYYACLKFDGDNMGDFYREMQCPSEHRNLSKKICDFANEAKRIIEIDSEGLCVYAGGEDVLAFIPIHKLFTGLIKLHEVFLEKTEITFSAGIVIAHLMQPLKEVLMAVGKMEHSAKQVEGKNAYSLSLMKRSGELRTVCYPFYQADDQKYDTLNAFNELIVLLSKETYSKALIYDLIQLLNPLVDGSGQKIDEKLLKILIKRIMIQKQIKDITQITLELEKLWVACPSLQDYINSLDMIGFLSREVFVYVPN